MINFLKSLFTKLSYEETQNKQIVECIKWINRFIEYEKELSIYSKVKARNPINVTDAMYKSFGSLFVEMSMNYEFNPTWILLKNELRKRNMRLEKSIVAPTNQHSCYYEIVVFLYYDEE